MRHEKKGRKKAEDGRISGAGPAGGGAFVENVPHQTPLQSLYQNSNQYELIFRGKKKKQQQKWPVAFVVGRRLKLTALQAYFLATQL